MRSSSTDRPLEATLSAFFVPSTPRLWLVLYRTLGFPGLIFLFYSLAKVASIALMCVQPEASHRPFMGEVVQSLKLVCNECDETKELGSSTSK